MIGININTLITLRSPTDYYPYHLSCSSEKNLKYFSVSSNQVDDAKDAKHLIKLWFRG